MEGSKRPGAPSLRLAGCWLLAATLGKGVVLPLFEMLYALIGQVVPGVRQNGAVIGAELFYKIVLVGGPVCWFARGDFLARQALRLKPMGFKQGVLVALMAAVSVVFSGALGSFWTGALQAMGGRLVSTIAVPETVGQAVLQLAVYALLPGVCEEFLFRGGLLSACERYGQRAALAIQAVLFALFHESIQGLWVQLIMGFVLGKIVLGCDSLGAGMLFHSLFNALTLLLAWGMPAQTDSTLAYWGVQAVLLGFSALLLGLLLRRLCSGLQGSSAQGLERLDQGDVLLVAACVAKMLLFGAEDALRLLGIL